MKLRNYESIVVISIMILIMRMRMLMFMLTLMIMKITIIVMIMTIMLRHTFQGSCAAVYDEKKSIETSWPRLRD